MRVIFVGKKHFVHRDNNIYVSVFVIWLNRFLWALGLNGKCTILRLTIDRLEEPFSETSELLHGCLAFVLQTTVFLGQSTNGLFK